MHFIPLHEKFPAVAEKETRCITLGVKNDFNLPADSYVFSELFCNDPKCDCRRVYFVVYSDKHKKHIATIAWGWEKRSFYIKWFGSDDKELIDDLMGPCLEMMNTQSDNSPALLNVLKQILLADVAYVERVKRHYAMFKKKKK